jgi:hypothetical protein
MVSAIGILESTRPSSYHFFPPPPAFLQPFNMGPSEFFSTVEASLVFVSRSSSRDRERGRLPAYLRLSLEFLTVEIQTSKPIRSRENSSVRLTFRLPAFYFKCHPRGDIWNFVALWPLTVEISTAKTNSWASSRAVTHTDLKFIRSSSSSLLSSLFSFPSPSGSLSCHIHNTSTHNLHP